MLLDSKPKAPRLVIQPLGLDFGTVRPGTRTERLIRIGDVTEFRVAGRLYLEEARTGLRLSATRFDSTPTTLMVTLDSTGYAGGTRRETGIRIQLDDDEMHLPVRFRVRAFPPALRRGFLTAAVLLLGMALWWVGGQRMAEWAWSNLGLPRLIATLPWLAEGASKSPSLSKVEADRESRPAETQRPVQPIYPKPGVNQQPPVKPPASSSPPVSERGSVIAPPQVPSPPPAQASQVQPSVPNPGASQLPPAKSPAPSPPPVSERGSVIPPPQVPSPPPAQTLPEQKPDVLETVRRLRDQGDLPEALLAVDKGLKVNPGSAELKNIREELRGRIHEASLGPGERELTQKALTRLGFDTKRIDGDFGPNTRSAIRQFQLHQRVPETGWLTDDQWAILMKKAKPLLGDSEKRPRPREIPPQGATQTKPSNRIALPAGQVECVGPLGTFVVDAVSCQRAGGQPKR